MTTISIVFGHDVEEEGLDVVVQRLRSKEEFREQTQVLAIDRVLATVNLEEGELLITIDFVARRMLGGTFELQSNQYQF